MASDPATARAGAPRDSVALLRTLVGFPTVSRDSNLDLIAFIRDDLAALGVESRLIYDDEGRKANLFATIGPTDRPGIILSGHTDVVPVEDQDWSADPFTLVEREGRLYGRGTCDMKGFIAVVLATLPEFLRRGLATPLHLSFSYDEEVGCLGVRRVIDDIARAPVRPSACIVGEPTEMKPVTAHKGRVGMSCLVHGRECHSSLAHQGVNAVEAAAELVAHLKRMARRFRDEGPYDHRFDPPYTTVHTGVIEGGTALNIVPNFSRFEFELRYLPSADREALIREVYEAAQALLPEMHAVDPSTGFRFEELSSGPGLSLADDAPLTQLVKALTGANDTGAVSFGTEGGLFEAAGIPTIICGPGNIEQAHKPDEYVAVDQLRACERFLLRLADRVCAA